MSSIVRAAARLRPSQPLAAALAGRNTLVATPARAYAAYWNHDWMPAPYPATPEQRVAAAKKYGLREEDYEPYPDDGFGYGDYPMLPAISTDSRSYHDTWDDPSNRRNYGEPMHAAADAMVGHMMDPTSLQKRKYSWTQMRNLFILGIGTYIFLYYILQPYKLVQPVMPKQFPRDLKPGEKHYTFEPAE